MAAPCRAFLLQRFILLLQHGGATAPMPVCPICAAAPRVAADVEGVVYESHLLLRWLSTHEPDVHPGSGQPIAHAHDTIQALSRGHARQAGRERATGTALMSGLEAARHRLPVLLWVMAAALPVLLLMLSGARSESGTHHISER